MTGKLTWQTVIRCSEVDRERLFKLASHLEMSRSLVIRVALKRLYEQELDDQAQAS